MRENEKTNVDSADFATGGVRFLDVEKIYIDRLVKMCYNILTRMRKMHKTSNFDKGKEQFMKRIFVMLLLFSMLFMSSCIRLPTDAETETTTPEEITTPDPWSSVAPNLRDPLERPQDAYDFRSLTEFQDVIFNPTMHQDHVLYLERVRHNQLHSEMLDFVYTQQKLHVPAIDDVPMIT